MPLLIRALGGLSTACFVGTAVLLVVAPDLARFGLAGFAVVVAGLVLATRALFDESV